jgi:hypothetical protein
MRNGVKVIKQHLLLPRIRSLYEGLAIIRFNMRQHSLNPLRLRRLPTAQIFVTGLLYTRKSLNHR